ncbi:MAG: hypothetical protein WC222_02410 [Parachlamydiales bacterium]|jgi:hypothetical protein
MDVYDSNRSYTLSFIDFCNEGFYKLWGSHKYTVLKTEVYLTEFNNSPWRIAANVICLAIFPLFFVTLICKLCSTENTNLQFDARNALIAMEYQAELARQRAEQNKEQQAEKTPGVLNTVGGFISGAVKKGANNLVNNTTRIIRGAEGVAAAVGVGNGQNTVSNFLLNKVCRWMLLGAAAPLVDPSLVADAVATERASGL